MYRLRCFGRTAIESPAGEEVQLRSRKHLALLVYLAAGRGSRYSRERLASLFWGTEPKLARHSLSQALYDITQNIPSIELHRTVREVGLADDGLTYDAEVLAEAVRQERLDEAVELYRGDFAPGLEDAGGDDFERWLDEERHRLRRLAETALLHHMTRCDDQARWGAMCLSATRLIGMNPLNERAHRAYLRALWLQGDQAAAVAHFESERQRLEEGLPGGIGEETLDLMRRIRGSRPAVSSTAVHERARPPMVGREEEFGELKRLLSETEEGTGRLAIVRGEAGMGKTRLLEEFHEFAALEGARVLESRCYSAETDVPFGPVVDGLGELAAELAGVEGEETRYFQLGHLFPEVFGPAAPQPDSFLGAGAGRRRLHEEVADLLRRACEKEPIVWLIDDAHWMDASSTSLVHYLVRRLSDHPVMVVCAAREEASEFLDKFRDWESSELNTEPAELELAQLSEENVLRMLRHLGMDERISAIAKKLHQLSGGNPLYIRELIQNGALENLPLESDHALSDSAHMHPSHSFSQRISESLKKKVSGLSPSALRILEIVAVAGRSTRLDVIADSSGYTASQIADTIRNLYGRGLLQDRENRVSFTHDLLRTYIYDSLGEIQRSALHLTVAEVLADKSDGDEVRALAHHFAEAGDLGRAYEYSLAAAQKAWSVGAHEEATYLSETALRFARKTDEKGPALQILADAQVSAGKLAAADATLRDMLDTQVGGTVRWLNTKLRLADLLLDRSRLGEAYSLLSELSELLETADTRAYEPESIAWAQHLLMKAALKTGRYEAATDALGAVEAITSSAESRSPTLRATAAISRAAFKLHYETPDAAMEHLAAAPEWLDEVDYELRIKSTYIASMVYLRSGHWDRGERWLDRAERWATQYNDILNLVGLLNNKVVYCLEKGEWQEVKRLAERVAGLSDSHDQTANAPLVFEGNLGHASFFSGNTSEAIERYRKVLGRIAVDENPGLILQYRCSLALAYLQDQEYEPAEDIWRHMVSLSDSSLSFRPEVQEYYKYLWLDAFFRLEQGDLGVVKHLRQVAELEESRDRPSAIKLAWLADLLDYDRSDDGGGMQSSMKTLATYETLRSYEMQWFAHSTNRWLMRARGALSVRK